MPPGGAAPTNATGGDVAGEPTDGAASCSRDPRVAILLGAVLGVALVGLLVLTGVGGATIPAGTLQQDNDTIGPAIGNATKVDDVTIAVAISDDVDVDETTVTEGDFLLSSGRLENVTVTEDGSNATARLHLEDPVNTDEVRVSVPGDAVITDVSGKPLRSGGDVTRTVENMDGVAPFVTGFRADPGANGTVDLRLALDDEPAGVTVAVTGPRTDELRLADFAGAQESGRYVYEATYEPGRDGDYRFRVVDVVDENGNDDNPRVGSQVTVDTTPPTAIAVVDVGASSGRNYTFDASRSTDLTAISNVTWSLGDGTNATGERVTHRYDPGNYTVEVQVSDVRGNTATDDLVVVAGEGNASVGPGGLPPASATVRLSRDSDPSAALVRVAGALDGHPVAVPAGSGRNVASAGNVTLERLTVTPARNGSYRLGIQADRAEAFADAAAATNGTALGGVTVVHEVSDAALANATLTVTVDRAAVREAGEGPANVSLYRRHDGAWGTLETRLVDRSNATLRYRATSPGFSRFALVAGGEGSAVTPTATSTPDAADATETRPRTTATPTDSSGSAGVVAGLLGILPLGLLDLLVRYVGSVVLAGFLLLKSVALLMGY